METYPLLQILIYLALWFVPADVDRITIEYPDGAVRSVTKVGDHWMFEGNETRYSINGNILVMGGHGGHMTSMSAWVGAVAEHDWLASADFPIGDSNSLTRTDDGFVFRLGGKAEEDQSFRIRYGKPSTQPMNGKISINVLGEVNRPGRYQLPPDSTVIDAIAAAGGWKPAGNLKKISVLRGAAGEIPEVTVVDIKQVLAGSGAPPLLSDRNTVFVTE